MNKAVPWNVSGVGFDAREAAREAARRQGKSLGEWLHSVIADHAADLGLDSRQVANQDRIDAVTAKLERLGASSAGPRLRAVPPKRDEDDEPPRRRRTRSHVEDSEPEPRRTRRSAPVIEETEYLLEEAIDAMERRASRSERRTDDALASFAKVLESAEARRDNERDAVRELSDKLSKIEAKLGARPGADETPIKGALARLEARLDTIGRRSASEQAVRRVMVAPNRPAESDSLHRLEAKLNTLLDVVAAKSDHPLKGSIPRRAADRHLGEAITEITKRQQILDDPTAAADAILAEKRRTRPAADSHVTGEDFWQQSLAKMQAEIGTLAASIDGMRRDMTRPQPQPPVEPRGASLDGLRSDLGSMSQSLRTLSSRDTISRLQTSIGALMRRVEDSRDQGVDDRILQPVEDVIGDLHHSMPAIDPSAAIESLKHDVASISNKIEGLTDASTPTLDRLQQQMGEIRELIAAMAARPLAVDLITQRVSALAAQVERAGIQPGADRDLGSAADDVRALIANPAGNAALNKIEDRLDALGRKLDAVITPRGYPFEESDLHHLVRDLGQKVEAASGSGANAKMLEALQTQVEALSTRLGQSEGSLSSLAGLERSMKDLFTQIDRADHGRDEANARALRETADNRTQSTLTAVHQMLEHVVGRMSTMEADMASLRHPIGASAPRMAAPAPTPAAAAPRAPKASGLGLGDVHPSRDTTFTESLGKPKAPEAKSAAKPLQLDDEHGRADYIAAARRAAKAAQADPALAALGTGSGAEKLSRESLLARSRDFVETHKRPVLLSVAAVFVVLGTMAIVQRMTFDSGDPQVAAVSPAAITQSVDGRQMASNDDLSPSRLPKPAHAVAAQIPGSDPVETASIQTSLPSFAAQAAPRPNAPRPALPSALVASAQSGDAAAQYELAIRYAEGKDVFRDPKTAATWFQKAADQGLAPAQYRLAALYEKGIGVTQDKGHARDLYLQAAEAGNPRAMHNLAVLMADGNGKPDYTSAASWFAKAASYGVHDSQYNLAVLLARGLGVEPSLVNSYKWFAIAAQQNDADAAKKRDEVADKLSANDLAVAKALVSAFQPRNPSVAATDVAPPPGGWDSLGPSSHINSAGSKISSL